MRLRTTESSPPRSGAILLCLAALPACNDPGPDPGDGGEDAPALVAEPTIVTHPKAPMVVDVELELDRPSEVELTHSSDPGVKVASLLVEDDGARHLLRVRGLAPGVAHELSLVARDASTGAEAEPVSVSFDADPALPGFIQSFNVDAPDPDAVDPIYRMFDYSNTLGWDPSGVFVVDPAGVTRWFYSGPPPELMGPTAVWAGVELLADGSLLVVRDGVVMVIDELGEVQRRHGALALGFSGPFHHDVIALPNGNFLTLSNSFEDVDYSALGYGVLHVAADLIVELDPAGEVVWTWDAFDHLDPQRIRAPIDENMTYLDWSTNELGYDWTHGNGLVYSAADDQILLSLRHQDWLVAIDRATGAVEWRLGLDGDVELSEGTWFHHQHSPQWQDDGSLVVYDNGLDVDQSPDTYLSRAVRYAIDQQALTATQIWDSSDASPAYSPICGDADRTPGGKLLVLDSALGLDMSLPIPERNWDEVSAQIREFDDSDPATTSAWTLTTELGSLVYRAVPSTRLPGEALEP